MRAHDAAPRSPSRGSSTAGQWSAPVAWPIVAVHMHLLSNGKVLAWGKFGDPYECDPATNGASPSKPVAELDLLLRPHLPLRRAAAGGRRPHQRRPRPARRPTSSTPAPTPGPRTADGVRALVSHRDRAAQRRGGGDGRRGPERGRGDGPGGLERQRPGGASPARADRCPYYPRTFLAPNGKIFYAGELEYQPLSQHLGHGQLEHGGDRRYGVAGLRRGGHVPAGQDPLRRRRPHDRHGGDDRPQPGVARPGSGPARWRTPAGTSTRPMLPTGEVLVTGGSARHELQRAQPGRARRRDLEPEHRRVDARWRATA